LGRSATGEEEKEKAVHYSYWRRPKAPYLIRHYVRLEVFDVLKYSPLERGVHFREHKNVGWGR